MTSVYCEKCRTRIASGNVCTTCGHSNPGSGAEPSRSVVPPPPMPQVVTNQSVFAPSQAGVSYQQPMVYVHPQAPTHGPAVASMVLGIISLVLWYIGIITGIVGLVLGASSLKYCQPNGPKKGRGMAIAGITCSIIALALWLIVLLAVGAAASS